MQNKQKCIDLLNKAITMELENDTISKYNHWSMLCGQEEDSSTKRLFDRII